MMMNLKNKTYSLRSVEEQFKTIQEMYPERDPETLAAVVLKRRLDAEKEFRSRVPEDYKDADFVNFGYFGDNLEQLTRGLFDNSGNRALLFEGVVGSGKTYSAYAAMNLVLNNDPERMVLFLHYPDLVQKMRQEFSTGTYNELGSTWDRINNDDGDWPGLVIIDDVGSSKLSEFETEKLYSILDTRLSNHEPMIVTTNVTKDQQESILGARVASRLDRFTRVEFPKHDFRQT